VGGVFGFLARLPATLFMAHSRVSANSQPQQHLNKTWCHRQTHTKTKIKAIAKAKAARTLKEIEMVGQNPTSGAKSF